MAEREERRVERAAYRKDMRTRKAAILFNIELGEVSTWDSKDERYLDAFIESEEEKKEDIAESESVSEEEDDDE